MVYLWLCLCLCLFVHRVRFCAYVYVGDCRKQMVCIHTYTFVKCTCLHKGHVNGDMQYTIGGIVLSTTIKNDLGLIISADMNVLDRWELLHRREIKYLE